MNFLIIIPAHNEEKNIFFCLTSLEMQSYQDYKVVVVDDGSTDTTGEISKKFAVKNSKFKVLHREMSKHEPGAKVVQSFNYGLQGEKLDHVDIICKFDADIIFPSNYLEEISKVYQSNPNAGMVSGIVKISKFPFDEHTAYNFGNQNQQWKFENISSQNHVRGPIKSYRKECYLKMKGLRPVLGWDNIDVMLAQMYGFDVITLKNLWVKHLRPTAFQYKNQKAKKLGEYFYNIGLNLPLAAISSAKSSFKNRSPREFLISMRSFLSQKSQRSLSSDEIEYIRHLRWNTMLNKKRQKK